MLKKPNDTNAFLFHALHRAYRNTTDAALAAHELSDVGQPMILFLLNDASEKGERTSQKNLAEMLHVSSATISNSLKSLEKKGYISKTSDEKDVRTKHVTLTEKGVAAIEGCESVFEESDHQMFKGFSEEERKLLEKLERRMLENLQNAEKQATDAILKNQNK